MVIYLASCREPGFHFTFASKTPDKSCATLHITLDATTSRLPTCIRVFEVAADLAAPTRDAHWSNEQATVWRTRNFARNQYQLESWSNEQVRYV